MKSIAAIWKNSKQTFYAKSLSQILSFAGNGQLKDGNGTSEEFRELLDKVPLSLLRRFADNCLTDTFGDSGYALQDIINQIGARLGFTVENGLCRGRKSAIGYDGIWTSAEGYDIVIEVRTSDAYRINLDTIAGYRSKLIEQGRIDKNNSSVLIIVGREDTGDLEAQIRGSKHAWDIRLLGVDSLIKLLDTKEALNDTRTIQHINEILKPREYTKLDDLVGWVFLTSQDMQLSEVESDDSGEVAEITSPADQSKSTGEKVAPVDFHSACISRIEKKLKVDLVKQSKVSYSDKKKSYAVVCSISKPYKQRHYNTYWFAFHPHQREFLRSVEKGYVAYGCGSSDRILLIPFADFEPLIDKLSVTEKGERKFWHVHIYERNGKYSLGQSERGGSADVTRYMLKK